jgi:hypothetical protein
MIPIDEKTYKADDGMKLTNGETFVDTIHLGNNDSIDNWHEITEEEAERLQNAETETPTEEEATDTDLKAQAYDILMGVTE